MALIGNPFVANVPRQFSNDELIQALRVDIVGEMEAIIHYEAHAMASNDNRVKKILHHIADEEKRHVGELQQLLYMINPNESDFLEQGKQTVIQQETQNFQQPIQ